MNEKSTITVVGSNMIDLTSFLDRFPKQGETVYGREFIQGFGGKGSNQAVMASLLGAEVSMITCVGNDVFGPQWFEEYEKNDINTEFVKVIDDNHSGVASIWVEGNGENRIVLSAGANEDITPEMVEDAFEELTFPGLVLSQLEIPQETILEGFKRGKEFGAATILNPASAAPIMKEIMEVTDFRSEYQRYDGGRRCILRSICLWNLNRETSRKIN